MTDAGKMSRDYAKQKRKASSKSSSFSDEATSPRDSLPLLLRTTTTSSTNPTPSVPSTPSQSFSPHFSYASYNETGDGDLLPTVSQLSSQPPSRQPSRRNSSFSESESAPSPCRKGHIDIKVELRNRLLDPSFRRQTSQSSPKCKNRAHSENPPG